MGTEDLSKDFSREGCFVIFQKVIPAEISLITGALTVLVIELYWSLVMISYFDNLSKGYVDWHGPSIWFFCVVSQWGQVTLFFFLIIFLTVITVPQCVLDIHALKWGNKVFPFPELTLLHRLNPEPWTELLDWESSSDGKSCTDLQLASHPVLLGKALQTVWDGCTLLSSWGSVPINAVWAVSKTWLSRRRRLASWLFLALFLFLLH